MIGLATNFDVGHFHIVHSVGTVSASTLRILHAFICISHAHLPEMMTSGLSYILSSSAGPPLECHTPITPDAHVLKRLGGQINLIESNLQPTFIKPHSKSCAESGLIGFESRTF